MKFILLLVIIATVYSAYRFRVPLLAKILGQPKSRIEQQLNRRRR